MHDEAHPTPEPRPPSASAAARRGRRSRTVGEGRPRDAARPPFLDVRPAGGRGSGAPAQNGQAMGAGASMRLGADAGRSCTAIVRASTEPSFRSTWA